MSSPNGSSTGPCCRYVFGGVDQSVGLEKLHLDPKKGGVKTGGYLGETHVPLCKTLPHYNAWTVIRVPRRDPFSSVKDSIPTIMLGP